MCIWRSCSANVCTDALLLLGEGHKKKKKKKKSRVKKTRDSFRIFEQITWHTAPPAGPALLFHLLSATAFAENQCWPTATVSRRSHQSIGVHQEAAAPASSIQSGARLDLCRMITLNKISSFDMYCGAARSLRSSTTSCFFLTHFGRIRSVRHHCGLLQHHTNITAVMANAT